MASKRRIRRKACTGKVAHSSQDAALSAQRRIGDRSLNAYRCKFCSQFHLGHPPARIRIGIAAKKRARNERKPLAP